MGSQPPLVDTIPVLKTQSGDLKGTTIILHVQIEEGINNLASLILSVWYYIYLLVLKDLKPKRYYLCHSAAAVSAKLWTGESTCGR